MGFHSPPCSVHTYALRSCDAVTIRFVRGAHAMPVTSSSCSRSVATRSHAPSSVAGFLSTTTVLSLGQTAIWLLSAFHAWCVMLDSTRASKTMAYRNLGPQQLESTSKQLGAKFALKPL